MVAAVVTSSIVVRRRDRRIRAAADSGGGIAAAVVVATGNPRREEGFDLTAGSSRSATIVSMFQVRIHGRGGQGVVTAAELLSVAAFREGRHAQAFPTFGSERTGAPVVSFCRIDTSPIRLREPIADPDAVIVQDPTLVHQSDVLAGLRREGYLIVNTTRGLAELGLAGPARHLHPARSVAVPATEIARRLLGRPLPNAALLGAFAALTGVVSLDAVIAAIEDRFPGETGRLNAAAASAASEAILERLAEAVHA